ncbi:MAG: dockerin type I domain-containing protein [Candidatus Zixiibacteriota bacterium]
MPRILPMAIIIFSITMVSLGWATPPPPDNYRISSPALQIQNEEQVWVCPTDSNVILALWRDFRLGYRQIGVGRSVDGGNTWTDSLVTRQIYPRQSDPCVDVDREGNMYLCFMDYNYGFQSTFSVLKSFDKGITWPFWYNTPVNTTTFEDKQFITIDRTGGPYDGNFYICWARFDYESTTDSIMFSRLPKDSFLFSQPFPIGPPPDLSYCGMEYNYGGQFAQPLVGTDGAVYVFWANTEVDSTTCEWHPIINMVKSIDGGTSFSPMRKIHRTNSDVSQIEGGIDIYNAPIGAIDIFGGEYDGNIYISYTNQDNTNTFGLDYNIEFIKSSDGGDSWTNPIFINDDLTGYGAMNDQFHPWLFCNEEGTLVIIFYDQRVDTLNHWKFDVFAAYSFDGGDSWTTNHRITTKSTDPINVKLDPTKGVSKAGKIAEYIGVTAFKDHINAVWTDGRSGNQEVWGANWITPLLEPRLMAPVNLSNIPDGLPHFNWATAWKKIDDRYRLEIARDNRFYNMVQTEMIDTTGYSVDLKAMEDGLYYWRVKSFKISTGDSSEYSRVFSFTVGDYQCTDSDGDGYGNPGYPGDDCVTDLCPNDFGFDNSDTDGDGVGNFCDNCLNISNPDQADADQDGIGDLCEYICGDVTGEGIINILDITFLIAYLYKDGPAPEYLIAGDANGSGTPETPQVNILDITYLIAYLYKSGPAPNCP